MREAFREVQHEVENHEIELRIVGERLNTQENILDSLREQLLDANLANQELVKGSCASLENRIGGMEAAVTGLVSDYRKLQSHANDSAKILGQYKQKIASLEKTIDALQQALNTVLDIVAMDAEKGESYEVKAGDSLEKIARRHGTTVHTLKELNGLEGDRIFVGQKLNLPIPKLR